jgi:RNA polymerase sigma-70 factor (ECF subfamily)
MDERPVGTGHRVTRNVSASWPPPLSAVQAAVSGDRHALHGILTDGYPRMVGFFVGIGLNRHEAEDLAAESSLEVVISIARLRSPQAFEAWFWAIARNRLRTTFRKRRVPRPVDAEVSPATPEETAIISEEHARIRSAMSQLSTRDRQLLWLREVEGLSYDDIGSRLGATVGTVRVACHRARQRLEEVYTRGEEK